MRLRIIQKNIADRDLQSHLDAAVRTAPDLVCFGEMATTGLFYERPDRVPEMESALRLLQRYPFAVLLGLPLQIDGALYNCCLLWHRGESQVYRKIHLFPPMNEPDSFEPGTEPGIFETDWGRVGAAICYDIRFDDVFDRLAAAHVGIIFIPAAFPRVRIEDWRRLLRQRAIRCGAVVAGINAVGDDGHNEFGGASAVVLPSGEVAAEAAFDSPEVIEIVI